MRWGWAIIAVSVAAPAAAQNSNTTCTSLMPGMVNCSTQTAPGPQPNSYQRGESVWDSVARGRALAQDAQRSADQRRVGALVASGHCNEARNEALAAGDFDLAERAYNLCRQGQAR